MPTKPKKTLEEKQAAMSTRQTAKHQLSRKDALQALSAEIANLEDGDPRKATLLARYLAAKPARKRDKSTTREAAVKGAIRNKEVIAIVDQNDCEAYAKLSPERRRAWRILFARETVRQQRGDPTYKNLSNHDGWGGPVNPEELATATLVEDGKLKATGYGVNYHDHEYVIYPTTEEGSAAIEKHRADCYLCKADPRNTFFFDSIFEETK
jgi:hypothetical protein